MILRPWSAILVAPLLCIPAHAITIQASLAGFNTLEAGVFEAAFDYWERTILDPFTVNLTMQKTNLAGDLLSLSSDFLEGANGLPAGASVLIDTREGSAFGWFIDPTPEANEEFVSTDDPSYFPGRRPGPAGQDFDLLTIVHHELAHILGFSTFYTRFASRVGPSEFGSLRKYQGSTVSTILTAENQGTHLFDAQLSDAYAFHFPDLMTSFQSRGERLLPSTLDLLILSDAFGYTVSLPATPIPEPLPFGLTAISCIALAFRRRTNDPKRSVAAPLR
jgi:hypothetical protein